MSKTSKRAITLFVIATMVLSMLSAFIAVPVMADHTSTATVDFTSGESTVVGLPSSLDVTVTNDVASTGNIITVVIDFAASGFTVEAVQTPPTGWSEGVVDPVITYTATGAGIAADASETFTVSVINPVDPGTVTNPTVETTDDETATQGTSVGAVIIPPITITVDSNDKFTISVDGAATVECTIAPSIYDAAALVIAIQTALVAEPSTVSWVTDHLVFTSDSFGLTSSVAITAGATNDACPTIGFNPPASETPGTGPAVCSTLATGTLTIFPATTGDFSIDLIEPFGDVVYDEVMTVYGSGVTSGSAVNIYWDFVTAANLLNSTTGKPSGEFESTVKVPSAYYGDHYIWVKDMATGLSARSDAIPVVSRVKLSPSSGLPKDNVIVKGYGFDVDSDIEITFFPTTLSVDGGVDCDETDDLGYFEYTFKVHADAPVDTTYDVYAEDADGNFASAEFTVGAAITLDKKVGPTGTIVKVSFRGFDPGTKINTEVDISLDGTVPVSTKDGNNVTVPSNGIGTLYVVIPSVETGDYKITVMDGTNAVKASFEVDGESSITVSPEYGTPGTVLTVKGYNFTQVSGTEVVLTLGVRTAKAKTDSSGSFEGNIVIPPSDLGEKYPVIANDTRLCHAEDDVLVTIIFLQLSDMLAPVGSSVTLMGSGFTDGGDWNATFGDLDLIETDSITGGDTYFSDTFHVPSLPSGTYPIGVYDVDRKITVYIDFTITEQAALSVNRVEVPNGYNLTLEGVNFAEYIEVDSYETQWWIFNSTDAWNLNDEPNVTTGKFPDGAVPETSEEEDEEGTFTGYYVIPDFLALGSYTINCTTVSNSATDPEIIQTAEADIKIVPEEVVINVGGPSYARGQTITFVIKATLQKDPFYLGIKDPEGGEVFNSTWELKDWKILGSWYYIPSNLQIDYNTKWLYTLPADATPGTWTYSFWDEDKEYKNGTFQITQLTEIEQLQQDIGEIVAGIAGMGASNEELAALVADLQGASAEAVAAAAAAAAAAGNAQTAAEAAMTAIADVDDTAGDALDAANNAANAADAAKDAADAGLQAALDALVKAQESVDAANEARESADANRQQTSGLTGLVYGAIGASLIAALAAIVSLMQISRRIAG